MAVSAEDQLAQMARYHAWATERRLTSIASIPDEFYRKPCGLFFRSIHGTLNHLLLTDSEIHDARDRAPNMFDALSRLCALHREVQQRFGVMQRSGRIAGGEFTFGIPQPIRLGTFRLGRANVLPVCEIGARVVLSAIRTSVVLHGDHPPRLRKGFDRLLSALFRANR